MVQSYKYSDINLYAGQSPTALVYDEASVNQNILLILMTPIRACWFEPELGNNLTAYLFDPIDDLTALKMQKEIINVLSRNGELRVQIYDVQVSARPNEQDYYIKIVYNAPGLDANQIVFDFNLGR